MQRGYPTLVLKRPNLTLRRRQRGGSSAYLPPLPRLRADSSLFSFSREAAAHHLPAQRRCGRPRAPYWVRQSESGWCWGGWEEGELRAGLSRWLFVKVQLKGAQVAGEVGERGSLSRSRWRSSGQPQLRGDIFSQRVKSILSQRAKFSPALRTVRWGSSQLVPSPLLGQVPPQRQQGAVWDSAWWVLV